MKREPKATIPIGNGRFRPPLRDLIIPDPWWSRAKDALARLLIRLRLRQPRRHFGDERRQWVFTVESIAKLGPWARAADGSAVSIARAVLATGVQRCTVRSNSARKTDANGLPPCSIEVLVQGGGDDDRIAEAISSQLPAGIGTHGTTSRTVERGGEPSIIRFTRVAPVFRVKNLKVMIGGQEIHGLGEDDVLRYGGPTRSDRIRRWIRTHPHTTEYLIGSAITLLAALLCALILWATR